MKKRYLYLILCITFVLTSCNEHGFEPVAPIPDRKVDLTTVSAQQVKPGQLIVKLKSEPTSPHIVTRGQHIGIRKMERVFPPAGEFEERSRAAGLHLWYVVEYDKSVPATRAAEELSLFDDVTFIEPVVPVKRNTTSTFRLFREHDLVELTGVDTRSAMGDPYLSAQWNFNNTGVINHTLAGADIRLFDAWKVSSGHPEVIVAVVDGGIDYTHSDLAANMWINTNERYGIEGEDDDKNGYKDDIYGFNFVTGKPIEPTLHGTHVAGTIAAVNNNGIGVSGIAGGDGSPNSGVRLMNCQIFVENQEQELSATNFYTAAAIKYAADNGAVICQNSWSFDLGTASYTPVVVQAAITYFIINAGTDQKGNQIGPMKGGLVVFAAGNDNSSAAIYPAFDDNVISVAAMAPDYKKATYSNYSSTVNIIAPGGEINYDPQKGQTGVLSTGAGWDGKNITKNAYYYMDGTSMACPHVSGVAALLVSHFGVGAPGFTPARLKEMLYAATYDISLYNPHYKGLLGVGALDAGKALGSGIEIPTPPTLLKPIPNQTFTQIGVTRTLRLTDYFAPGVTGEVLAYGVSVNSPGVIEFNLENEKLSLTTIGYGKTGIAITATGLNGLAVETSLSVSCYSRTVWEEKERPGFWTNVNELSEK